MTADVIQLKPKRPRRGGGHYQVHWQCPDCPNAFCLSYGYTALAGKVDRSEAHEWRVEVTCTYCGAWMEIPKIGAEGGRAR